MTVLRDNCVSCHNPEKKKGGLVLLTRRAALDGGDSGPALFSGDAEKSPIVTALAAEADPHMPPKAQLAAAEIATLRSWVEAGASWDEHILTAKTARPSSRPVTLHSLPATYHPVMAMALSPDQKRLAIGHGDHLLVFDLARDGRTVIADRATPGDLVQSLAWSPDGSHLATGGFGRVRLWEVQTPEPVQILGGWSGRVTALCFTPDGSELLAGEGEGGQPARVRVWHVSDGHPLAEWEAHGDAILAMKISGDGKLLVTGGADKQVKLWDLPSRRELGKLEGHTAQVMAVAISPDATRIASAGADKEIKIWDLKTRDQIVALLTNPAGVTDLTWVDDKVLLSSCEDGVARFSNVGNKDRAERSFTGAGDVLYCATAARGGTVYAGCHDGFVYLWTAATGKALGKLPAEAVPPIP